MADSFWRHFDRMAGVLFLSFGTTITDVMQIAGDVHVTMEELEALVSGTVARESDKVQEVSDANKVIVQRFVEQGYGPTKATRFLVDVAQGNAELAETLLKIDKERQRVQGYASPRQCGTCAVFRLYFHSFCSIHF